MKAIRLWVVVMLYGLLSASSDHAQTLDFAERTLTVAGRERFYWLYVPPSYSPDVPMPLVFVLHGGGGNPSLKEPMTHFGQKAHDEGFILVYPAGTGRLQDRLLTWNSGYCCGYAYEHQIDDVAFFRVMVTQLSAELTIDPHRIYAAGHSNGGMMAYRLAAEASDLFAAVGVMAGSIGGYPTPESTVLYQIPMPSQAVSIIHIHGMRDANLPYEGGINDENAVSRRNDLSVADAMAFWVQANQCDPQAQRTSLQGDMLLMDDYACQATQTAIRLITIVDGGHSWAGNHTIRLRPQADPASRRVVATDVMWEFFEAHPKP